METKVLTPRYQKCDLVIILNIKYDILSNVLTGNIFLVEGHLLFNTLSL